MSISLKFPAIQYHFSVAFYCINVNGEGMSVKVKVLVEESRQKCWGGRCCMSVRQRRSVGGESRGRTVRGGRVGRGVRQSRRRGKRGMGIIGWVVIVVPLILLTHPVYII